MAHSEEELKRLFQEFLAKQGTNLGDFDIKISKKTENQPTNQSEKPTLTQSAQKNLEEKTFDVNLRPLQETESSKSQLSVELDEEHESILSIQYAEAGSRSKTLSPELRKYKVQKERILEKQR